jgi:hypothetical protein
MEHTREELVPPSESPTRPYFDLMDPLLNHIPLSPGFDPTLDMDNLIDENFSWWSPEIDDLSEDLLFGRFELGENCSRYLMLATGSPLTSIWTRHWSSQVPRGVSVASSAVNAPRLPFQPLHLCCSLLRLSTTCWHLRFSSSLTQLSQLDLSLLILTKMKPIHQ